ncbi:MAG TPA: hypothetical protein VN638_11315, partial [Nitrospiraceae bacterium]|nr:hypothetical protein [Nitrospiraceae bacterium]
MPARFLNWVIAVTTVMVAGTSGALLPSFVQAKEPMPTFELDRIIDLALERNPLIAGAQSAILQNEGLRTQAGAFLNPTVSYQ